MKTIPLILTLASIPGLLCAAAPASTEGNKLPSDCRAAPVKELNPAFASALYQQLHATEGNVFFSPYSISEAMGMVYMGAKGNTATEIAKAMSFDADLNSFARRMPLLRHQVTTSVNQKGDKLSIANALCVTGYVPLQSYQNLVREQFEAELFSGGLEEINAWAKKKTEGQIDQILQSLDPNSACVLLNAVYFKGNWKTAFKPSHTYDSDFYLANGKKVKTKMMNRRGDYHTVSNEKWIAVELPYKGGSSMVLIMPTHADQFAAFEAGINEAFLAEVDKQLSPQAGAEKEIELMMPKFKIATSYSLPDTMKTLGVTDAFEKGKADFSAMYERSDISIGQIIHKATLEVDELGSVASAVTAVEMTANSIPQPVPAIHFDRPFLVRIRENTTNSTLFMGRISDPSAK